jgi:hypothetical protein
LTVSCFFVYGRKAGETGEFSLLKASQNHLSYLTLKLIVDKLNCLTDFFAANNLAKVLCFGKPRMSVKGQLPGH